MKYPATEKLEIIRLVEQSSLPVRHTLAKPVNAGENVHRRAGVKMHH